MFNKIILPLFFLMLSNTTYADCYTEAKKAVKNEIINYKEVSEIAETYLEFHCKEASKIEDIRKPYIDSVAGLNDILSAAADLLIPLPNDTSLEILFPYCRNEETYFGSFCMATDVHSSLAILRDKELLKTLPVAIKFLGQTIKNLPPYKKFDIISELTILFKKSKEEKRKAVLIGSFLGLDDNNVQIFRLLANLLYIKDYQNFAKIFATTLDYQTVLTKSVGPIDHELGTILFSTRMGTATLSTLFDYDNKKTYKLYSSIYFGCQMAMNNKTLFFTTTEAEVAGMAYELLKLRSVIFDYRKLLEEFPKRFEDGKTVGKLMAYGAEYGFQECFK